MRSQTIKLLRQHRKELVKTQKKVNKELVIIDKFLYSVRETRRKK